MHRPISITRPCPISLDALGVDRSGPSVHCAHCDAEVHALYKLTRAEAEAFVASRRGEKLCVSLRVDAQGNLRFADSSAPRLIPASRLRTSGRAAAGLSLALVACTPHGKMHWDDDLSDDSAAYSPARPTVLEQIVLSDQPPPLDPPEPAPTQPPRRQLEKVPPKKRGEARSADPVYDFEDDILDGGL